MSSPVKTRNLKAEKGGLYITDTGAHTGDFDSVKAQTDSVLALVSSNIGGTISAVPVAAGDTIFGKFTSVTFSSGEGFAYYAV